MENYITGYIYMLFSFVLFHSFIDLQDLFLLLVQDIHKLCDTSVACAFYCFHICSTFNLNYSTKLSISKIYCAILVQISPVLQRIIDVALVETNFAFCTFVVSLNLE